MVLGMGMRTVWISLRAVNYTDQAFRASIINLKKLENAERNHLNLLFAQKDMARYQIQTNMLYAATLAMVYGELFRLTSETEVGAEYMSEFNETVKELKTAFADTFFEILRPVLDVISVFMGYLKEHEVLRKFVGGIVLLGGALLMLIFVYKIISGLHTDHIMKQAIINYLTDLQTQKNIQLIATEKAHIITIHGVSLSYFQLAAAVGMAGGAMAITFMLLKDVPAAVSAVIAVVFALAAAFWALFVAESAASLGVAAALGGVAAGAAAATVVAYQSRGGWFQKGTRALPFTGPFWGHKGEIVYNPSTGRPAGVRDILTGEGEPSVTNQDIDINVEHLHTEASFDEIDSKIARKLRRNMRSNR